MTKRLLILVPFLAACTGSGSVAFTTYGEDFIEKEIPAKPDDPDGVEDGWTITFSKFLVSIGEITVADHEGEAVARQTTAKLFDLKKPGPVPVERFENLPAEEFTRVSFAISPVRTATEAATASAEDLVLMRNGKYSVYVEGEAVKGAEKKTFKWGFPVDTVYEECTSDFGKGVTVPDGGELTAQLTMHGDHLFFDDLQSEDAVMRFDAIAAADVGEAGGAPDGEVTLEELAKIDLTELPANQYGTGGAGHVRTLKDFITAQVRSIGHFRGEGECLPKARTQ